MESISRRDLLKTTGVVAAGAAVASMANVCTAQAATGPEFVAEVAQPAFLAAPAPIPTDQIAETRDYDVVVVGAGAAGVPAALSALEAGAKVALLQKEATAVSQGNSGTGIDLENSDPAGVEALVSLEMKENAYRPDRKMLANWAWNSGEAVKWVIAKAQEGGAQVIDQGNAQQGAIVEINGYKMNYVTSFFGPKPYNTGDGMIALAGVAEKEGAEIFYETPAQQLVCDNGKVTGVIAQDKDGKYIQFNAAKGVIVATGDYQNDLDMCSYYLPDLKNLERKQFNKTGDGHKMVVWAGGKISNIVHTKMMHDFDAGPMWNMPFLAVKTATGERFMNEKIDMAVVCNYLTSEEDAGRYCQVFDSKYADTASTWKGCGKFVDPDGLKVYMQEEDVERKGVLPSFISTWKADTLEELGKKMGVGDIDAFVETVKHYNEICEAGADTDFGKEAQYLVPVDSAPYYGISRTIRVSAICTGVDVNKQHQCLDEAGEPIEGLYAVGNCSGGFYGGVDYPLTVGGLSIGRCYTEGYVTGKLVASL